MTILRYRMPCGHYAVDDCDECRESSSPDPWLIAGGDVNLNRQAETRNYRQAKFRKV